MSIRYLFSGLWNHFFLFFSEVFGYTLLIHFSRPGSSILAAHLAALNRPLTILASILKTFWEDFWRMLGGFREHLERNLGGTWLVVCSRFACLLLQVFFYHILNFVVQLLYDFFHHVVDLEHVVRLQ